MRGVERVGDLDAQIEHRLNLHRLAGDAVPEGLALQQFHGDESSAIGLVNFVNGADVGVVQRRRGLGFALETAESLRVVGEVIGQEFQGNVTAELEVFGLIHHTHPTTADLAKDAVVGDRLPHGLGGGGHWVAMLGGAAAKVNVRGLDVCWRKRLARPDQVRSAEAWPRECSIPPRNGRRVLRDDPWLERWLVWQRTRGWLRMCL